MIALSAAALIAAVPAAFAQSGATPGPQHKVIKKSPPAVSNRAVWHDMKTRSSKQGYPATFGYAPYEPKDYATEMSRQAGGGM
jgi:hypothetical protein